MHVRDMLALSTCVLGQRRASRVIAHTIAALTTAATLPGAMVKYTALDMDADTETVDRAPNTAMSIALNMLIGT